MCKSHGFGPFFDEYNKMVDVNSRLQAVMAAIRKIDSKIEHKQELQKKYRGPQYQKFKVKLIKELGKFKKAFEKSCELLEEYQPQTATLKKESVLKQLRANVEDAKLKPHKKKDLEKNKDDDPR